MKKSLKDRVLLGLSGLVAATALTFSGCTTTENVGGGALIGGGAGAIIGHQSGHSGEGALIGAGIGILGGLIKDDIERQRYCPSCGNQYKANTDYCPRDGTQTLYRR